MNISWGKCAAPGHRGFPEEFAQCRDFLDEGLALSHLSTALEGGFRPLHCEIFNIWYIPRKALQVVYQLYDEIGRREVVTIQFSSAGTSGEAFERARGQAARPDLVRHLAQWEAVAWLFPADARLPALPEMIDGGRVAERMNASGVLVQNGAELRWSLLSYLPGDRCAIRYRWGDDELGVVAKLQTNAAASHQAMLALWSQKERHFGMAQPMGCDAAHGIRWERFVSGRRIDELAPQIGLQSALLPLMRGVVQLHRTPIDNLPGQGTEQVIARLQKKVLPRIRDSLGALSAECDSFAAELAAQRERLPQRPPVTIHGDLHTANILITADGPVLIDLDSLAHGEPAFDLALLGSRLLLIALNGDDGTLNGVAVAVAGLPELYEKAGGDPVPQEVFAWFMAALFVGRQIKTCIRHLAPSLDWISPVLLRIAQLTLQRRCFEAVVVSEALALRRS